MLQIYLQGIHHEKEQRTTCQPPEVQSVLDRHRRVFDEDISGYNKAPVHIELKANATPRFCKARPVPLALRTAVVDALCGLEREGIIKPVQHAQ